ncbi:hypothetical protein D9M69_341580 [compost metagenome]
MLLQLVGIARRGDRPDRQVTGERLIGRRADPAAQLGAGLSLLAGQFVLALGQLGRFLFRGHRVRGLGAASGNLRPHGFSQHSVLAEQFLEQRLLALDRETVDPGQRSGLADFQTGDAAFGLGALDGGCGHFDAGPTLVAVRHFLHDPDHLHGHEVLVDAPAVGAADGIILHAEQQLGVRQLAGGNGGAAGRLQLGVLSGQRGGVVFGQP